MKKSTGVIATILTALTVLSTLSSAPASAITPSTTLTTLATSVRAAAPANDASTFLAQVRSYASARALRVKASDARVTVWNPRRPAERVVFTVTGSAVTRSYVSASVTSNNRRELELFSALDKSSSLAKAKSSVIFAKADRSTFAGKLPVGSTTARRGSNGDISIVTGEVGTVLLGNVLTAANPKNWTTEQRAAFSSVGADADAQLLRRTVDTAGAEKVRSTYSALVRTSIANLIVQAFDSPKDINVTKTKSGSVYRIRSTVSSTFSPKARGEITTSFVVRAGRVTLAMVSLNATAAKYGSSVRVSVNPSTGKVRGLTGSVTDFDKVSASTTFQRIADRAQGTVELQSFLRSVVIADDAAAVTAALAIYKAGQSTATAAERLAQYGRAVQWSTASLTLCGRLDLVAGVVIAETDCTSAGFPRS